MMSDPVRGLADLLMTPTSPLTLRKAKVTALTATTFTAQIEGATTTVPGLTISKPFVSTLAVDSVVWLLCQGPVYLLVHQES